MSGSILPILIIIALVFWRRTRSMYKPIRGNGVRLLIPLIFILLPLFELLSIPNLHVKTWEWLGALLLGIVFSLPLIWTTGYEIREDNQIYAKKNIGFIIALVCVFGARIVLRAYLSSIDQQVQLFLFVMVAVGYLVPWRIVSYLKFRRLYESLRESRGNPG